VGAHGDVPGRQERTDHSRLVRRPNLANTAGQSAQVFQGSRPAPEAQDSLPGAWCLVLK